MYSTQALKLMNYKKISKGIVRAMVRALGVHQWDVICELSFLVLFSSEVFFFNFLLRWFPLLSRINLSLLI